MDYQQQLKLERRIVAVIAIASIIGGLVAAYYEIYGLWPVLAACGGAICGIGFVLLIKSIIDDSRKMDEAERRSKGFLVQDEKSEADLLRRANCGKMYSNEKGAVLGNHSVTLPDGHTYESFAMHLLSTMPKKTAEHYKNKLAVYLKWWSKRGYPDGIPDMADKSLESKGKVPTWRKVVKTFLKNDYWCKGLGFSPTKSSAYDKYMELCKKRRQEWGIFCDTHTSSQPNP